MSADQLNIAIASHRIRPVKDFGQFAKHCTKLLDQASEANLVLFPELFTLELFTTFPGWENAAIEELPKIAAYTDDYLEFFTEQAKQRGQFIAAGTHLEEHDGRYFNYAHLFGPDGETFAHAKTHIFPAEDEWHTAEGDSMKAFELPWCKVGFNICYESEIPECAAALTEQGVELILCPSYTFAKHGYWRVRHCGQARAIENQIYFAHCATGGTPGGELPSGWTKSAVYAPCDGPWPANGLLAVAPRANVESVISVTLDFAKLRQNRVDGAATTFNDRRRRANVYRSWPSHLKI